MDFYQVEPESDEVPHSIPTLRERPYGIAWDEGFARCVESNHSIFYKMNPKDGTLLEMIQRRQDDPEPHPMSMRNREFRYCDAVSRRFCRLVFGAKRGG